MDYEPCDWTDDEGRHCLLFMGHAPIKSPSGPHVPDRPSAKKRPIVKNEDPLSYGGKR